WAESPTVDYWLHGQENRFRQHYEYTSTFLWSNTVHQAASACYDYFKWGDYLTGTGNDHAEGAGWIATIWAWPWPVRPVSSMRSHIRTPRTGACPRRSAGGVQTW